MHTEAKSSSRVFLSKNVPRMIPHLFASVSTSVKLLSIGTVTVLALALQLQRLLLKCGTMWSPKINLVQRESISIFYSDTKNLWRDTLHFKLSATTVHVFSSANSAFGFLANFSIALKMRTLLRYF